MSSEALLAVARKAGEAIMEVYRSDDVGLREKDDRSPLTAADLAAEAVIQTGLAEIAPRLPILSE